jgi:predicted GIY-YIG superfamily endonuclease
MNETFRLHVEALHPAYERLVASAPFKYADLAKQAVPERGIYLLTEGDRHLYVGRSDNIRQRLRSHCAVSATQEHFRTVFEAQKARLREMGIRVVEEADPNRQALLEMYVSIALGTPYNDFANH